MYLSEGLYIYLVGVFEPPEFVCAFLSDLVSLQSLFLQIGSLSSLFILLLGLSLCLCYSTWWCPTSPLASLHFSWFFFLLVPLPKWFSKSCIRFHWFFLSLVKNSVSEFVCVLSIVSTSLLMFSFVNVLLSWLHQLLICALF